MLFSHSLKSKASLDKLWENYSNVENWAVWDASIDRIALNGKFQNGITGVMKLKQGPTLSFTLENVDTKRSYDVVAHMGAIEVRFSHVVTSLANNETEVRHEVKLTAPADVDLKPIMQGITASIPGSMEQLVALSVER